MSQYESFTASPQFRFGASASYHDNDDGDDDDAPAMQPHQQRRQHEQYVRTNEAPMVIDERSPRAAAAAAAAAAAPLPSWLLPTPVPSVPTTPTTPVKSDDLPAPPAPLVFNEGTRPARPIVSSTALQQRAVRVLTITPSLWGADAALFARQTPRELAFQRKRGLLHEPAPSQVRSRSLCSLLNTQQQPQPARGTTRWLMFEWDAAYAQQLPYIISGYVQLVFNIAMVGAMLFLLYYVLATISKDVDLQVDVYTTEMASKISTCAKYYIENKCDPGSRIPAMEKACSEWEVCMSRDPRRVDRARVSAETFAGILNGFVEPMSFKTMAFILLCVVTVVFVTNLAFSMLQRGPLRPPHQDQQQQQQQAVAPPLNPYYQPYQQQYPLGPQRLYF